MAGTVVESHSVPNLNLNDNKKRLQHQPLYTISIRISNMREYLCLVKLLWESYILVYKLVVMGLIVVEYIRVGRTGVNVYSIRIKLQQTQNTAWVLLFQLSKMRGLYREPHLITGYQISQELPISVKPVCEAVSSVVA